jgi:hypothetical protein
MTRTLCWCASCESHSRQALKMDRTIREFDVGRGEFLAEAVGRIWGSEAGKTWRASVAKAAAPRFTKEATDVAHITDTDYEYGAANVIGQAVSAALGDGWLTPGVVNKSAGGSPRAGDPFTAMQAVYSLAMGGDPVAVASWATIQAADPATAALVPAYARACRPATDDLLAGSRKVRKSVRANITKRAAAQRRDEYAEWLSGLANSGDPRTRAGAYAALAAHEGN